MKFQIVVFIIKCLVIPEAPIEEPIQKTVQVEIVDPVKEEPAKEEEEEAVKDSWDLESSEDEEEGLLVSIHKFYVLV